MSTTPRQKACHACAESKRRCDKQLPECQRCIDRDVDCTYPQSKRRRTNPSEPPHQVQSGSIEASLDMIDWDNLQADGVSLLNIELPMPTTDPNEDQPWFLQEETWATHNNRHEVACTNFDELEPFIKAVEEMLRCWVSSGHNSFIHRRLYALGMPAHLQQAFTTLAAYNCRTPAMKDTILQIAEDHASSMMEQTFLTSGAQGILHSLAHLQALFIYEFILLFDGSIRFRASAEKRISALRQRVRQTWQLLRDYRGEDILPGFRYPPQVGTSGLDSEHDAWSAMWQQWILTESARRTCMIVDTVANIYQIMVRGWAECTGGIMFTATRGLWDAESPARWFEMCCGTSLLLVPSLQPGLPMAQHGADEFDDLAKLVWSFIVGKDKIQSWIDTSGRGNEAQTV